MSDQKRNNTSKNNERDNQFSFTTGAAVGLVGVAFGGALYYMSRQMTQGNPQPEEETPPATTTQTNSLPSRTRTNATAWTSSQKNFNSKMPDESENRTDGNKDKAKEFLTVFTGVFGVLDFVHDGQLSYIARSLVRKPRPADQGTPEEQEPTASTSTRSDPVSSYLSDLINRISTSGDTKEAPENPDITNLNSLLSDIHVRYSKQKEFDLHYKVFDAIFLKLHTKMKEVDPYYRKYASTVFLGPASWQPLRHNIHIKKPDKFDMDIVIGLPWNIETDALNPTESGIIIEPTSAGFVQLKMGVQFQRLPMRDKEEWLINRAAFQWKDDSNYLLRSKFNDWFKSVVNKALNKFEVSGNRPLYYVEGVPYIIDKSESGPAMTLLISNKSRKFKLDVDLVPCLKFPEDRWPIGKSYRQIPQKCKKYYWMVVGKPNKESPSVLGQLRSWRLALHNQERELMNDSYDFLLFKSSQTKENCSRQAIWLMKKLRESLGMEIITCYHVKTLFYWNAVESMDADYWRKNNLASLFKLMVGKLHQALVVGKIPYFWNKDNNLIGNVDRKVLNEYLLKLVPLIDILDQPDKYKMVAKYLLTPEEFADYNRKFLHI
ncbi:uncharacterized protein LOC113495268 [Trichoplusia ni]|uniref:Uncharacterized protein LOC113495268 n=1 Tax=Trichoplusia ni TaxID=7111 RepID=A0A7E5VN32_TRINI|nr:uncharacterized protein LOC113495268 [Trichoplusia ni]XP_026729730.1 uncharacterized protein LOC113495268 [Trichoplusia ni]